MSKATEPQTPCPQEVPKSLVALLQVRLRHHVQSICATLQSPVKLLDTDQETLEELVHIEGFGKSEADCLPLTKAFSEALCTHYKIEGPLEIYLNGKHLPSSTGHGEDPGS